MSEQSMRDAIIRQYDAEAEHYEVHHQESFAWLHIEQPALDNYIGNLIGADIRALDVGCGAGAVTKYLIGRGATDHNIVGVDVSEQQIQLAQKAIPKATFIHASADTIDFPANSFDLVVSNMALHHLDNEQFATTLDRITSALRDNGTIFIIDTHPDYSDQSRDPLNVNQWITVETPWGGQQFLFNRGKHELLRTIQAAGLEIEFFGAIDSVEAGKIADPINTQRVLDALQ